MPIHATYQKENDTPSNFQMKILKQMFLEVTLFKNVWVTGITDIHWHVPFKCITLMMVVCMLVTGTSIYGVINIMVDICRHGCTKVFI